VRINLMNDLLVAVLIWSLLFVLDETI
jgi:hypothetical protein